MQHLGRQTTDGSLLNSRKTHHACQDAATRCASRPDSRSSPEKLYLARQGHGCSCRLNRAAHFFRLLFEPEPAAGERRGLRALSLPVYKFSLEAWLEYRFRADRISYQKLISAPNMAA